MTIRTEKRPILVIAVAAIVVWLAAYLSIHDQMPSPSSPFSLVAVLPAFLIARIARWWMPSNLSLILSSAPLAIFFIVWSFPTLRIHPALPRRSIWLFLLFAPMSALFLWASWPYGLKYQGLHHTVLVSTFNAAFILALSGLVIVGRRSPARFISLAFHTLLFGWLGWCAFPWLGELL